MIMPTRRDVRRERGSSPQSGEGQQRTLRKVVGWSASSREGEKADSEFDRVRGEHTQHFRGRVGENTSSTEGMATLAKGLRLVYEGSLLTS